MAGNLTAMIAAAFSGSAAPPVTSDPYFEYTTLLLPGNGTNGAQNNTFLDSSANNFTITRNGNTTQGTFSPFSQTGWGNYFNGSGDCLSIPTSAISAVGSNNFSMECWVYPLRQTNTYSQGLISYGVSGSGSGTSYISFELNSTGYAAVAFAQGSSLTITSSTITPINQWSHIALCRSGSTLSIFLNGTRVATTSTSATVGSSGNVLFVGSSWYANEAARNLQGYISNARIVNGASAYDATQSTITVPTSPLTAISSTSLLTCQSNRFVDNSASPLTITVNGTPSVQAFSPFNPSASWSAATYGGSGYFDGNGDYLTTTDNAAFQFAGGNFTIESWVYPTTASQMALNASGTSAGFTEYILSTTNFLASTSGSNWDVSLTFTNALTANAWNHVALVRNGNVYTAYKNGEVNGTVTVAGSLITSTAQPVIGSRVGQTDFSGYMSSLRLVKGTAVYTSNFTPPTAPLTAITNTSLLLNFTNAGIYDATSKNDLETVGDAKISTAQSKWGGSSMYFDGAGDYLNGYNSGDLLYLSTTYTIEFWLRLNSVSGNQNLICLSASNASNQGINSYTSGTSITIDDGNTAGTGPSGGTLAINTWYHVALVANGTNTKLFIDGTLISTYGGITRYTAGGSWKYITVGTNGSKNANYLNGYINDLRITNATARYTANFTPPTAAFPTL